MQMQELQIIALTYMYIHFALLTFAFCQAHEVNYGHLIDRVTAQLYNLSLRGARVATQKQLYYVLDPVTRGPAQKANTEVRKGR